MLSLALLEAGAFASPGPYVPVGFAFHSQRLTAAMQTENHKTLILVGSCTWTAVKRENVFGLCLPISHPPLHTQTFEKRSRQILCSGSEFVQLWDGPIPCSEKRQWIWGSFGKVCEAELAQCEAPLALLLRCCDLQWWMWWCLRFGLGAAPGHRLCTGFLGSVITRCSAEHSPSSAQFEQLFEETFTCCRSIICWVPHISGGPLFFSLIISQYMFGLLFCKPFQEGSFWTHCLAFDCKLFSYCSHRHACEHPHSSGNTQLFIIQAILFGHNSTVHDCCHFLWEKWLCLSYSPFNAEETFHIFLLSHLKSHFGG